MNIRANDAPRIGIYVRTIVQNQELLERQEEDCRRYANRIGGIVEAVYRDDGRSALFPEWPALQQMLEDIKGDKKFDLLVVQDLTCLACDFQDMFNLFVAFTNNDVGCIDASGENLIPDEEELEFLGWDVWAITEARIAKSRYSRWTDSDVQ